ncbi:MAG: bifunctional molybdenum cofactor biosynthesis protein MoaC/MoaB [Anaerolineae bacterium]
MRDVTAKPDTRRTAVAESYVAVPPSGVALLRERRTDKGDPLEVSRVAGIAAAKRTSDLLPFCHPIPVTHVDVDFAVDDGGVRLTATATAIAPTGVEMEALTAAGIAALNLYDMLKPHVEQIVIHDVRLVAKHGGKGDHAVVLDPPASAAVLVLSDSVAAGKHEDTAGRAVVDALRAVGGVDVAVYEVLADDAEPLKARVSQLVEAGTDLVITVGGTGLGVRDRTIEALQPLIEVDVPGIAEAARSYGQRRTPRAMLSRGIAGLIGSTLVLTLPGSRAGAQESVAALFPAVLHVFQVLRGEPHAHGHA